LSRKLCPRTAQPSASNNRAIPTKTSRMFASFGKRGLRDLETPFLSVEAVEFLKGSIVASPEPCPARGAINPGKLSSCGGKPHNADLVSVRSIDNAGHSALSHNDYPITHA